MRRWIGYLVLVGMSAGCGSTANVAQEKDTLMRLDREWSASVKDTDKFLSYYAADASVYPPGMPVVTGAANIRETFTQMSYGRMAARSTLATSRSARSPTWWP